MRFHDKVIMALKSVSCHLRLLIVNKFSTKKVNTDSNKKNKIIVSLTTYSKRLNQVHLTIESLFQQKLPPDEIHLWLARSDVPDELPKTLVRLMKRGLSVHFLDENFKSYKKLSYCKNFTHSSDVIITADDDVFYPQWWLNKLIETHLKFPRDIICYRAHWLQYVDDKLDYNRCMSMPLRQTMSTFQLLPTGVSGILYPSSCLSDDVFDLSTAYKLCPKGDDIWYRMSTLKNGCSVTMVYPYNIHFPPNLFSLGEGLVDQNVHHGENNKQLISAIDHFVLHQYFQFSI